MTYGGRNISVSFGDTLALDGVDFAAPEGEVTAVVGGDGVGKTTLLRVLVGLVEPSSGIVATPPVDEIGYLPALGGSWKDLTVAQKISFVGGAHGPEGDVTTVLSSHVFTDPQTARIRDRSAMIRANYSAGQPGDDEWL